jgi:hypothetical protein
MAKGDGLIWPFPRHHAERRECSFNRLANRRIATCVAGRAPQRTLNEPADVRNNTHKRNEGSPACFISERRETDKLTVDTCWFPLHLSTQTHSRHRPSHHPSLARSDGHVRRKQSIKAVTAIGVIWTWSNPAPARLSATQSVRPSPLEVRQAPPCEKLRKTPWHFVCPTTPATRNAIPGRNRN